MSEPKTPHCCPICWGKGLVAFGFYTFIPPPGNFTTVTSYSSPEIKPNTTTSIFTTELCRTCSGKGIVWEGD